MADAEPSQKRIKRTEEEASESDEGSDTEEDELTLVAGARRGKHEEEDEEDEDEDGDEDGDIVNVDFGLFDPQEIDFLSLKRFLKGLLPGNDDKFAVGASALSEAIIQQPQVGTMVKVGDDVDVWAFATMLPWGPLDESPYRKEIARFLLAKCPDLAATSSDIEGKTVKAQLERFLDGSAGPASILLSERMVNFPPELAPAIFESLLEDVNWARDQRRAAAQSGSTPAGADPQWVLCLAPCYVDDRTEQGEPPPRNPAPKRSPQPCPRPPLRPRPDELLHASAVLSFDVRGPTAEDSDDDAGMSSTPNSVQQLRRVFVFPAEALRAAVTGMASMVVSAREMEAPAKEAAKGAAAPAKAAGKGGKRAQKRRAGSK
ncbi:bcp1 [Symbiodinium sp. KB8]|nr:bcp1 [Symbiodinium sp. KB8]